MRSSLFAVAIYGSSIAVSALVTLLLVPVVIANSGAEAWSGLALGQTVGVAVGVLVGFGWGTTGPTEVAQASERRRPSIFFHALRFRALFVAPGVAVAMLITFVLAPSARIEGSVAAAAFVLTGMGAGWYFTGAGRPMSFLLMDTVPRVAGSAIGGGFLLMGTPLIVLPIFQVVGCLAAVLAASVSVALTPKDALPWPGLRTLARRQVHGLTISSVSAAYLALPSIVVAWLAPAALPVFAMADKLLRFGTSAFAPVTQFLQGWVPKIGAGSLRTRVVIALGSGAAIALTGAIVLAAASQWASRLLSHGEIVLDLSVAVPLAGVFLLVCGGQVTGLVCLLALGQSAKLALFTTFGAVASVPLLIAGVATFGALGAVLALVVAELVSVVPQVLLLMKMRAPSEPGWNGRPSVEVPS